MRALWLTRPDLEKNPGEDTTQIAASAAALRALGVEIEMRSQAPDDLASFDVVHLFHLERLWENLAHAARIRRASATAVLSTIYWPGEEFDLYGRSCVHRGLARAIGHEAYQSLRLLRRRFEPRLVSYTRGVQRLLDSVALLLPNSEVECEEIEFHFGRQLPTVTVPSAVDAQCFAPPPEESSGERSGVLCAGRIEPRKNQLALIRALSGRKIPLRLVSQPPDGSAYFKRCEREADESVEFLHWRAPAALAGLYRSAAVHACVSWYETPGLTSMEASLCGAPIVATDRGSTLEYFGGEAHYCEPTDTDSIREAVEAALETGPSESLAEKIRTECTWERAAEAILEGYREAIDRRGSIA